MISSLCFQFYRFVICFVCICVFVTQNKDKNANKEKMFKLVLNLF